MTEIPKYLKPKLKLKKLIYLIQENSDITKTEKVILDLDTSDGMFATKRDFPILKLILTPYRGRSSQ